MDLRALGLQPSDPAASAENTVSYEIYPDAPDSSAEQLEALRAQLLEHVLPLIRGYIWQRDRFALHLSTHQAAPWQLRQARRRRGGSDASAGQRQQQAGQQEAALPHLWGSVNFGDNVEDEWFVTWLLLELTRAFPVTARVWDNDGEFLLIEAAYGLPRWLKPETAANRVWLHGGALHLVPLPRFAGDPLLGPSPTLAQALAAVRGGEVPTQAPPKMQAALQPRLFGYPGKAAEEMHVARALVPARVAVLLREEPQLVAAAVEAFHYRDVDDAKAAARMSAFPPRDLVLVAPTLSRCLYAQLALQEFAPPRGYPMPLPSDPLFKAAEVGMKLTAGFEMMLANRARFGQPAGEDGGSSDSAAGQQQQQQGAASHATASQGAASQTTGSQAAGSAEAAGLAGDPAWAAFRSRLDQSAYFQGSLPGSALHSQLLAAAADSYRQTAAYRASTAALAAPALRVQELLSLPADPASFPSPEALPPAGGEEWMQAGAERLLEAELARRQAEMEGEQQQKQRRQGRGGNGAAAAGSRGGGAGGGGPGSEEAWGGEDFDPSQLAGRLRAFVDMAAGLEGAELPSGSGTRDAAAAGGEGAGGVALDEAAFAAELQRVLGLSKEALRALEGRDAGSEGDWESSDEGSSFFSDGGDSEEEDEEEEEEGGQEAEEARQPQQPPYQESRQGPGSWQHGILAQPPAAAAEALPERVQQRAAGGGQQAEAGRWDADTETDSDDEAGHAEFMEAYGQAMDAQLGGTRMAESFERAPAEAGQQGGSAAAVAGQQGGSAAAGAGAAPAGEGGQEGAEAGTEAAGLRPVDVDLNLVSSLLASYGEQQGLPGPAGSLAGLLGLSLPDK